MTARRTILRAMVASIALASGVPLTYAQTRPRRIGFLFVSAVSNYVQRTNAFIAGMRDLGYIEGKDYVIERKSAESDLARLPALARELISLKVDVIVVPSTPSALAAHQATREIPIIVVTVNNPVE